jgi:hypothetical protein
MAETHGAFASPLTQSRPRDVSLTAGGRTLVGLAVVLVAGAIVAGVAMYRVVERQADERRAILTEGVMTTGTVTRLWNDDDNRRKVRYQFAAQGRIVTGEQSVSSERRRTLHVQSPIDVRYVPSNPAVNDLGGPPRSGMPVAVPFMVPPVVAGLGVLCLVLIHRQRRLLVEGRVAPGIVTGHTNYRSSHGGTHRSITFTFPLLSGAIASGKSGASRKPPAIGSAITVIYDPDEPSRSAVYPFSLVRPAR